MTTSSSKVEAKRQRSKAFEGLVVSLTALLIFAGCFKSACASGGRTAAGVSLAGSDVQLSFEEGTPPGFMKMEVMGVLPTTEGNAVFLADRDKELVLPIWIGPSEAMSIQLRMERRRFERPLTHDLLDELMKELGARVLRVHIDDLKGSTFVATVIVQAQDRVIAIDARPSDAIAVAVGSRAPIFVALDVIDRAGIGREDVPARPFDIPSLDDPLPDGHQLRDRSEPGLIGPPPTQSL